MSYERRRENSNYTYESRMSKLCNRCGNRASKHTNPGRIDRECDDPRYLYNYKRDCGCFRTPIIEMMKCQRKERDPDANVSTHCCGCKRATKLTDLQQVRIEGRLYEKCIKCRKNSFIPEKEEFYEYRRSQREKRESSQSYEAELQKKQRTTPGSEKNIVTKGSTYNPGNNSKNEIDWTNDTEEQIRERINWNNKGKSKVQTWREVEEAGRTPYCTGQCQFFHHKELKDGRISLFDANQTMIHDTKECPHGAFEYDENGIGYEICTCYRKGSKYCFEHDHETNSCDCEPQVFWSIKSFAGTKCRWEQCMHFDEYQHCEHMYCWKHEEYGFNKYTKCRSCKRELGVKEDEFWNELVQNCVIQRSMNKEGLGRITKGFLPLEVSEVKDENKLQDQSNEIKQMLGVIPTPTQPEIVIIPPEIPTIQPATTTNQEVQTEVNNNTLEQRIKELERQLEQIKEINDDQGKQIEVLEETNQKLWNEMKGEQTRVEILTEELRKYAPIEIVTWEKGSSTLHCENCNETDAHYEYCVPCTINYYKTLYYMEKVKREEKESDLEQYNILFSEYQEQERVRNEGNLIQDQEAFEAILENFDGIFELTPDLYAEELK